MRKWIIGISSLVLAGAAAFLLLLSLGQGAGEEITPTQTTAAQTLATTVATTALCPPGPQTLLGTNSWQALLGLGSERTQTGLCPGGPTYGF